MPLMNLVELANGLLKELGALQNHVEKETQKTGKRYLELKEKYNTLLKKLKELKSDCDVYFGLVRELNESKDIKCPWCTHSMGYHPKSGEFQAHLGCSREVLGNWCGCLNQFNFLQVR